MFRGSYPFPKLQVLGKVLFFGAILPSGIALGDEFDPPTNYYANAEGLSGAALKSALHNIIDGHRIVAYSWPPYQDVDEAASNPSHVELIYTNATRAKNQNGGNVGDWNREHLWPKSYGVGNDGADTSDMFNLRPSDVQVNSERGSLYFDNTDPATEQSIQFNAPGCSKDSNSWEPRDDEKGDIARSLFYMAVRYDGSDSGTNDLELSDNPNSSNSRLGRLLTLIEWHFLDPVDQDERERNHAIFQSNYQGNRNPFIDRPDWVEKLFFSQYPRLDSDGDGINDWWEWRQVGSLDQSPSDDGDGDKMPFLLEFVMNTNAGSMSDLPHSNGVTLTSTGNQSTFSYRLNALADDIVVNIEGSPNLAPGSWQIVTPIGSSFSPIDEETSLVRKTFSNTPTRYFYRLRATVEP